MKFKLSGVFARSEVCPWRRLTFSSAVGSIPSLSVSVQIGKVKDTIESLSSARL